MSIKARVISTSRRHCWARTEDGDILKFVRPRAEDSICVGDFVCFGTDKEFVELLPRKNLLKRSTVSKEKIFASNLDHLYIITAPEPPANYHVLDKYILIAIDAKISVTILANKQDISSEFGTEIKKRYPDFNILSVSALEDTSLKKLGEHLKGHCAFCGISGVGKSSLIKALTNNQSIEVGAISEKTRQGRQTTTQSRSYLLENGVLVTDLPGVQSIGLHHVSDEAVRKAYPEFSRFECEYSNCKHLEEESCGVKDALIAGDIPETRYESYKKILVELVRSRAQFP